MNEQNFVNLGSWWARKMSKAQEKLISAIKVSHNLNLDENYLRGQWNAQRVAVTKENPGEYAPIYRYIVSGFE